MEISQRSIDRMGWNQFAQLAPDSPVALAGTLDRAVEHMPGDEGKQDRMSP
jgi:hypothetical protein